MKFRFALLAAAAALAVGSAQASTYSLLTPGSTFRADGLYESNFHMVNADQTSVWQFYILADGILESVNVIGPDGLVTPDLINPNPISGSDSIAASLTFFTLPSGNYYLAAQGPAGVEILDAQAIYPSPIPEPQAWSLALAGVLMSAGLWARRARA
jgi:hypothetical protein